MPRALMGGGFNLADGTVVISPEGLVDGRDVSVDGAKLDTITEGTPVASGVDNQIVRYDGTSSLAPALVSIDDSGNLDMGSGAVTSTYSGTGDAFNISLGDDTNAQAIVITEDNVARTQNMVYIASQPNRVAGANLYLLNSGQTSSIIGRLNTSTTNSFLKVSEDTAARNAPMVLLETQPQRTYDVFKISNEATATNADSVAITQYGGGHALHVWLGHAYTNSALRVTEGGGGYEGARTPPMIDLQAESFRSGPVIGIVNPSSADSINIAGGNINVTTGTISGTRGWKLDLSGDGGEYLFSNGDGLLNLVVGGNTVAYGNAGGFVCSGIAGVAGTALKVTQNSTTTNRVGLDVTESAVARSAALVQITRDAAATGRALRVINAGSSHTVAVEHSGAAHALNIALATDAGSQAIVATEDNVARGSAMMSLTRQALATGSVAHLVNYGSSFGQYIQQIGASDALRITLATDTGSQAIVVTEDNVARTNPMVELTGQVLREDQLVRLTDPSTHTHAALDITRSPGASVAAKGIQITSGANVAAGGSSLSIAHAGAGAAEVIYLNGAEAGVEGFSIWESDYNRTAVMMKLARHANATGTVLDITNGGAATSIDVGGGNITGTRGWKADFSGDAGEYLYSSADHTIDVYTNSNKVFSFGNGSVVVPDDQNFLLGTTTSARLRYLAGQTPGCLAIMPDATSNTLLVVQSGDHQTNFGHSAQTNPTIFVHQADEGDITSWTSISHGEIATGSGTLALSPAGGAVDVGTADITGTRGFMLDLSGDSVVGTSGEHIYSKADNSLHVVSGVSTSFYTGTTVRLVIGGGASFYQHATWRDNYRIAWGTSDDAQMVWSTAQTPDSLMWGLGVQSNSVTICETADVDYDFAHPLQTNPTLWIQSANQSATEWGSIAHDQTDFVINQGAGTTKLSGGQKYNITTVNTATYDLLITDMILHVTYTSTGAVTSLTLPTAQTEDGRVVIIKDAGGNASANNITIDTEGAQTIDGAATYVMATDYQDIKLYSDGSNWHLLSQ